VSKTRTPSLSERTAKAGLWVVSGKLFAKSLDFVSLLILARFLGASEFGVVSMAMTAVLIVEALSEMPLSAVLLNYERPTDAMYDTAFSLALLRGAAIVAVLSALSWPLSLLYHEPRLIPLQCALAWAPAMRGMINPRLVEYTRVFDFRRDVALDIMAKTGALVLSATLAITTRSYWAIAIGTIATTAIMMIVSYFFAPQRLRFGLSRWHIFMDMVGWNAAGQLLNATNWQTDKLILPRFVDIATFGRFTSADNLIGTLIQAVIMPITRPLFSAFIAVRQTGDIQRVYLTASAGIFTAVGPIFLMLAMLSHPVVRLMLGPKWDETAPILTWLAFSAIGYLTASTLPSLAMATNRTSIAFKRLVIEFCVKVPLVITLGFTMKVQGVLIGHAVSSAVSFFVAMLLVRNLIGLTIWSQVRSLSRPLLAMVPMALFLFAMSKMFSTQEKEFTLFVNLCWVCTIALIIYAVLNLTLWKLAGSPDGCEAVAIRMAKRSLGRFSRR